MAAQSPHIVQDSWGQLEIEGYGTMKDAKLWPGGARPWDWNEHGTDHGPGIQPGEIDELTDHGAGVIILSRGRQGRLTVPDRTIETAEAKGAEVKVMPTDEAIAEYNRLADTTAVAALIHSTC
jgi:hypothetical protein